MGLLTEKNALWEIRKAGVVTRANAEHVTKIICIISPMHYGDGKSPCFLPEVDGTVRVEIFLNKWNYFLLYGLLIILHGL